LRAGAALIDIAARQSAPPLDWHSLDAIVFDAAEQTAQQIKAGTLKPVRSMTQRVATIAAPLALAASVLFGLSRLHPSSSSTASTTQHSTQQTMAHSSTVPSASQATPVVHPQSAEWDSPRVLFATRAVESNAPNTPPQPVRTDTVFAAHSQLRTTTSSARALVALAHGQRLDLRANSVVVLQSATRAESAIELVSGEARVDVMPESGRVSMTAREWGLSAKAGSVVAKFDGEVLQLSVLSGEVSCRFQGGAEQRLAAGARWTLGKNGSAVSEPADGADPQSLEAVFARLTEEGTLVGVGAVPEGARLSFADHLNIPSDLSVMRLLSPIVLRAERASLRWEVRLDPSQREAPDWALSTGPSTEQNSASRAAPVRHTAASVVLTLNTISPEARTGFRAVQSMLGRRTRHCFDRCELSNSCGETQGLAPTVQLDGDGRVASVQLSAAPGRLLAMCIENEVRAVRLPMLPNTRVNLGQFAR
jgi:hypothetical protein